MRFTKNNIEKDFEVHNGHVRTCIRIGKKCVVNPTLAVFAQQGWVEVSNNNQEGE